MSHLSSLPLAAPRGHVLLVDDDPAIRASYARVLERRGYSYRVAENAVAAYELLGREPFDAVVSDVMMPGIDGVGLLRLVRGSGNQIPFVLMTGAPQTKTAIDALELGAAHFLLKPMEVDALGAAVDDAVRRTHEDRRVRGWIAEAEAEEARGHREDRLLDSAISTMWPAFQPIVASEGGGTQAYEALMRTRSEEVGGPLALIELAERRQQLVPLGRRMRALIAEAMGRAPAGSIFFVNLHSKDLEDPDLFDPAAPLSRFASRVVLEITERASLPDDRTLQPMVAALRALGFRLAVDDLGAGYAGLTSLAVLQPEFVKLDAGLIRGIDRDPVRQRLVAMLADYCRVQGATVIAEGVESAEEREALIARGCAWLQGYLFARPTALFAA